MLFTIILWSGYYIDNKRELKFGKIVQYWFDLQNFAVFLFMKIYNIYQVYLCLLSDLIDRLTTDRTFLQTR